MICTGLSNISLYIILEYEFPVMWYICIFYNILVFFSRNDISVFSIIYQYLYGSRKMKIRMIYSVAQRSWFLWRMHFCGARATHAPQKYILVARLLWRILLFRGCATERPKMCATTSLFPSSAWETKSTI